MDVKHVLVVDDDADMRMLLASFLQMAGWDVCVASGGREALQIASSKPVDAIMLDMQMPGMDGPQVFTELRRRASTSAIPCILFSQRVRDLDAQQYLDMGFAGVLPKSFVVENLVGDVSRILGWDR